jgi:hypothetical protein
MAAYAKYSPQLCLSAKSRMADDAIRCSNDPYGFCFWTLCAAITSGNAKKSRIEIVSSVSCVCVASIPTPNPCVEHLASSDCKMLNLSSF